MGNLEAGEEYLFTVAAPATKPGPNVLAKRFFDALWVMRFAIC